MNIFDVLFSFYSTLNSIGSFIVSIDLFEKVSFETLFLLLFIACFFFLLYLEARYPKNRVSVKEYKQSFFTNVTLLLFNNVMLSYLSIVTLQMWTAEYSSDGLLSQVTDPVFKVILSLVILDVITYLWHVACHRFNYLWMFHRVHHSDPCLNVSTAFRLHFMELALFFVIKLSAMIVLGIDKATALFSEMTTTLFVMFHHCNISFSAESWLSRLIIVPSLHRYHHSIERIEHDRNYGAIFSLWDRLFGTLAVGEPVAIGIKNDSDLSFLGQLKLGLTPSQTVSEKPAFIAVEDIRSMIAEAAYYKSVQRDFSPGNEMVDWLEAEADIRKAFGLQAG